MPFKYKIDVLAELKAKGYNTNTIRKEKLIGEAMLTKIRNGEMPSWAIMDKLCELLDMPIGDIIEYEKK